MKVAITKLENIICFLIFFKNAIVSLVGSIEMLPFLYFKDSKIRSNILKQIMKKGYFEMLPTKLFAYTPTSIQTKNKTKIFFLHFV